MAEKQFAIVGNWGFAPAPKGISTFAYDPENGTLKLVETIRPDLAAGQLCIDQKRGIVYAVHECGDRHGEIGGGGYVLAFSIDPESGKLKLINQKDSLSPEPSYLCLDKTGKYLLVCHCGDPWHVTKIVKKEDGSYGNEVLFDDVALVLFRIEEDGSLGDICDVVFTRGSYGKDPNAKVSVDPVTNHIQLVRVVSRQHAIVGNPNSELFMLMDKGMDRIYSFALDRAAGRLVQKDMYEAEEVACFPRYGAFHPTLPIFYADNENLAELSCFHYDETSGKMERFCQLPLLEKDPGLVDGKPVGAQDILVSPDGNTLYVTLCGINAIVVAALDESGNPKRKQIVSSGGILPRGICLSPDGKFLLAGNMVSGDIVTFYVEKDGTLKATGSVCEAVSPSAIRFFPAAKSAGSRT